MVRSASLDGQQVMDIVDVQTNHATFITNSAYLFQYFQQIFHNAALGVGPEARRLWARYYPRLAFLDEAVVMPPSSLAFIVTVLLAFAEVKSQGEPGFPFRTHPHSVRVSFTGLLMYAFASASELVISAAGFDRTSVYATISRLGRIGSLLVLVAALASFFC